MVLRVTSLLRTRWRSLVGLVLLIGLTGGGALGAIGIMRRTDTAFDRAAEEHAAADVLVNPNRESFSRSRFEQIAALPMVAEASYATGTLIGGPADTHRTADDISTVGALAWGPGAGTAIERPMLTAGRAPDPEAWDEVLLEQDYADRAHLRVGDLIPARVLDGGPNPPAVAALPTDEAREQATTELFTAFASGTIGTEIELRVVGVGVSAASIALDDGFAPPSVIVTPAFRARFHDPDIGWWGTMVRLRDPAADEARFREAVDAMFADSGGVVLQTLPVTRDKVQRAVRPQVLMLQAYAAVVLLLGLLLVGQAVARQIWNQSDDNETLRAIGFTRRQLAASSLVQLGVVAVAGGMLAVAVAVMLSPLGPMGVVRVTDLQPGPAIDPPLLVVGGLAIVATTMLLAALPAWRAARRSTPAGAHPAGARAGSVRRFGTTASARVGLHLALADGGRGAARRGAARRTVAYLMTAVALLAATAVVAASLDHLLETPSLFGAGWQVAVRTDGIEAVGATPLDEVVASTPSVTAAMSLTAGEVHIDGRPVPSVGFVPDGPIRPTIVDGRAPSTDGEVALAADTLDQLGRRIGDTVSVSAIGLAPIDEGAEPPAGQQPGLYRIVGRAVLPGIGPYSGSNKTTLTSGALFTNNGLGAITGTPIPVAVVADLAPGASAESVRQELDAVLNPGEDSASPIAVIVMDTARPSDIVSLAELRHVPGPLSAILLLVVFGTIASALFAAVRRQRGVLALLRTFGGTRAQLRATLAWHASTVALIGGALGLVLGVAAGRFTWQALAASVGFVADPVAPLAILGAVAVLTVVLANLGGATAGHGSLRGAVTVDIGTE